MKPFVHLHVHTEYSLLDGAAKISKIFNACKEKNMPAIAMTDHGNMYAAVKFVHAAKKFNDASDFKVKPIIGCEFYICNDLHNKTGKADIGHLILLAKNQDGYTNLVQLNSIAFVDGFYYKPRIDYNTLEKHSKGLVCLSACLAGHIQDFLVKGMYDEAKNLALRLKNMFDDGDFYMELQNHGIAEQLKILEDQKRLAKEIGIKTVVTNDVHYVKKDEAEMQDVMLCVQTGRRLDDVDRMRMPCDEFYLKTYDELLEKFPNDEDALDRTLEIAEKCNATVLFGQNLSPGYNTGTDETPTQMLRRLTYDGLNRKYGTITEKIKDRVEHELKIIDQLGYSDYFLIVWDFVHKCFELDIPVGPGRGSAAGSIVSYALDITKIEPLKHDLIFERFLNPDRISPPDIDLDFCFYRRGEVIDYVTEKYGQEKVCQIVTFGTMAAKAAIKDVARVLSIPYDQVNKLTKDITDAKLKAVGKDPLRKLFGVELSPENEKYIDQDLKAMYDSNEQLKKCINLAIRLEGMPRHTGMHAAGVVICREVVSDFIPLAKNGDDITTQFDMREIEEVGTLKMDFLGLKTLTDIKRTLDLIEKLHGKKINVYSPEFSYDDPEVYKMIASGATDAVFQIESGGMKKFMKELKPDNIEDLIAGIAMFRPGPMDDIPKFIANKQDPAHISYDLPELEPILKPTYGVIVYQEQVMRIVQELAGYSLSQADDVRKMMGKKLKEKIAKERKTFIEGRDDKKHPICGALAKGVSRDVAESLWDKMEKFGSYAFNKSHSAVYAYIAYQTAFLKRYYEVEFICSVLNNRITDSKDLQKYLIYMKQAGIELYLPSVNKSDVYFQPEGKRGVRFGLGALKNVGIGVATELCKKREEVGEFKDIVHLIQNLEGNCLNKRFIESLILSGAMDEFNKPRSCLMSVYGEVIDRTSESRKNKESGQFSFFDSPEIAEESFKVNYPNIPEYRHNIKLKYEKEIAGAYISGHPLDQYLDKFKDFTLTGNMVRVSQEEESENFDDEDDATSEQDAPVLENNMPVTCGGIIVEIKKVVTKSAGKEMAFVKIEDLEGPIEIMFFPQMYEKYKKLLEVDSMISCHGKLSIRADEAPIVLADKIDFWNQNEELSENVAEEKPVQTSVLCLKYSTLDNMLCARIYNILRSHAGNCTVKVRCAETGKALTLNEKVEINDAILRELEAILPKEHIFVRVK